MSAMVLLGIRTIVIAAQRLRSARTYPAPRWRCRRRSMRYCCCCCPFIAISCEESSAHS